MVFFAMSIELRAMSKKKPIEVHFPLAKTQRNAKHAATLVTWRLSVLVTLKPLPSSLLHQNSILLDMVFYQR